MSSRQDALEEKLSGLEEKLHTVQVSHIYITYHVIFKEINERVFRENN